MRKVILTTGGTGGHIFPALAVAEELKERWPDVEILFMGGSYGPEKELAEKAGLPFMGLAVRGFFGRGLKALGAGFMMLRGVMQARSIIKNFAPDVVIGFGGYAAAAGLFAARLRGVPTLVHEQNSVPGIANRLLGRMAQKVCISLPDAEKWFPEGKCVLTGNPVRKNIRDLKQENACALAPKAGEAKEINLLVLGGSQGAKAVNSAVLDDLEGLLEAGLNIRIQSGKLDYERVQAACAGFPPARVRVDAFIDDMNKAYEWADLSICRAGATTLAELAVAGVPAVFVPYPFATHNHQYFNAQQVQKVGAARLMEQKDIKKGSLLAIVRDMLADSDTLRSMSCAALLLAQPKAAGNVAEEAEKIVAAKAARAV